MKKLLDHEGPFDEKLIEEWHEHLLNEDQEIKELRGPIKWSNKNNTV